MFKAPRGPSSRAPFKPLALLHSSWAAELPRSWALISEVIGG